jgi:hypothetical protein
MDKLPLILSEEYACRELYDELVPLFQAEQDELSGPGYVDYFNYDPQATEAFCNGNYLSIVARSADGRAVGYAVGIHIRDFRHGRHVATVVGWYMQPQYRGSLAISRRLLELFERAAVREGAEAVEVGTGVDSRMIKYMQRLGYGHSAYLFEKEVRQ